MGFHAREESPSPRAPRGPHLADVLDPGPLDLRSLAAGGLAAGRAMGHGQFLEIVYGFARFWWCLNDFGCISVFGTLVHQNIFQWIRKERHQINLFEGSPSWNQAVRLRRLQHSKRARETEREGRESEGKRERKGEITLAVQTTNLSAFNSWGVTGMGTGWSHSFVGFNSSQWFITLRGLASCSSCCSFWTAVRSYNKCDIICIICRHNYTRTRKRTQTQRWQMMYLYILEQIVLRTAFWTPTSTQVAWVDSGGAVMACALASDLWKFIVTHFYCLIILIFDHICICLFDWLITQFPFALLSWAPASIGSSWSRCCRCRSQCHFPCHRRGFERYWLPRIIEKAKA